MTVFGTVTKTVVVSGMHGMQELELPSPVPVVPDDPGRVMPVDSGGEVVLALPWSVLDPTG